MWRKLIRPDDFCVGKADSVQQRRRETLEVPLSSGASALAPRVTCLEFAIPWQSPSLPCQHDPQIGVASKVQKGAEKWMVPASAF